MNVDVRGGDNQGDLQLGSGHWAEGGKPVGTTSPILTKGCTMLTWISKCVVIVALYLSANMLAMPILTAVDSKAEAQAVGGIPDLRPLSLKCQENGNCPMCVPHTSCPASPSYDENGQAYCECEGGHDGCSNQAAHDACLSVCGIYYCLPDPNLSPCGHRRIADSYIDDGVCKAGVRCLPSSTSCHSCIK